MFNLDNLDDHSRMLLGITPLSKTKLLCIAISTMMGVVGIVLVVRKISMSKQH